MPPTTMDDIVSALSTLQQHSISKLSVSNGTTINWWSSSWRQSGSNLAAVPATGVGETVDHSTLGAVPFTAAGASKSIYLYRFGIYSSIPQGYWLFDRLVQTSGLSGTTTGAQTVNTVALPSRATGGDMVELWIEWYTTTGASAVTITASYTNQAGTASRTTATVSLPINMRAGTIVHLPLQAGDTGVRSVQSVTISATTGTAGNFGVTLVKRIASLPVGASGYFSEAGFINLGMPKIDNNACLFIIAGSSSANSPTFEADMAFIEAAA